MFFFHSFFPAAKPCKRLCEGSGSTMSKNKNELENAVVEMDIKMTAGEIWYMI